MKVTVFGATGGVGHSVVRQLLGAGHDVTAVIRSGRVFSEGSARLAVVPDLIDTRPLIAAIAGSDAVISAIGPRSPKARSVASTATGAILRAMQDAGVRRLVAVSSVLVIPAQHSDGVLIRYGIRPIVRSILCDIYLDLARMEGEIEISGSEWTVIRAVRLSDGPLTGRYRTCLDGNVPRGYVISRADVAHAMVAAMINPAAAGHAIGVAN